MNRGLDDPGLVRRLRNACRRVRPPPTGRRMRSGGDRRRGRPDREHGLYRLILTGIAAIAGGVVSSHALGAQLLTIIGILLMAGRIRRLHQTLAHDPALPVLARLPVPDWMVFDYQTRGGWRDGLWAALDGAAFWTVAWAMMGAGTATWVWLPVIAAAHAAITWMMVVVLVRVLPDLGCLPLLALLALGWGIFQHRASPWLWSWIEPVVAGLAWVTPWGWLNRLAQRLPSEGAVVGGQILAILGMAVAAGLLAQDRLRRTWTMPPFWREVAGRPAHTWAESAEDHHTGSVPERAQPADHRPGADDAAPAVTVDRTARLRAAWGRAWTAPWAVEFLAIAWAGPQVHARLRLADRWVAEVMRPEGPDRSAWNWALILVLLPAGCALTGLDPRWGTAALLVILVLRHLRLIAGFIAAVLVTGLVWAPAGAVIAILALVIPVGLAWVIAVPLAGGSWSGLPMGSSLLGCVPRRWAQMFRIMLAMGAWRLLAGLPVALLSGLALGYGIDPSLGTVVVAVWLILLLSLPWLCAGKLLSCMPGGIAHLGLGRWWLTTIGVILVLMQTIAAGLILAGACFCGAGMKALGGGIAMLAIGVAASVLVTAGQVPLLRHAYRRRVDLIPPV